MNSLVLSGAPSIVLSGAPLSCYQAHAIDRKPAPGTGLRAAVTVLTLTT